MRKNLPITWQSFAAIGPRSSEISWRNQKKTSAVKHKPTWNYRSGWPNKDDYQQVRMRAKLLSAPDRGVSTKDPPTSTTTILAIGH